MLLSVLVGMPCVLAFFFLSTVTVTVLDNSVFSFPPLVDTGFFVARFFSLPGLGGPHFPSPFQISDWLDPPGKGGWR